MSCGLCSRWYASHRKGEAAWMPHLPEGCFAFVEVEVRPAAATALFPKDADLLAHPDALARPHGWVDGLQMGVAIVPAVGVEDVDVVVVAARLVERGVAMLGHGL